MIYIQEAHAMDTWPLGLPPAQQLFSTHTLEARVRNARQLLEHEESFPWEVLVDVPPRAAFNERFASWPLRFWVLDVLPQGKNVRQGEEAAEQTEAAEPRVRVSYLSQPEGDVIDVPQVERYLQARFPSHSPD
jgi:hypothetical protein